MDKPWPRRNADAHQELWRAPKPLLSHRYAGLRLTDRGSYRLAWETRNERRSEAQTSLSAGGGPHDRRRAKAAPSNADRHHHPNRAKAAPSNSDHHHHRRHPDRAQAAPSSTDHHRHSGHVKAALRCTDYHRHRRHPGRVKAALRCTGRGRDHASRGQNHESRGQDQGCESCGLEAPRSDRDARAEEPRKPWASRTRTAHSRANRRTARRIHSLADATSA
jgi:hypothetical protein